MKKFLFTLAALLMASSAFAKSYLYVNDFEVPASYIGTGEEYEMIVSAHFEECVSAWDTYFTFPEGMTCTGVETGADWAIATYNNRGKAINYAPPLYGAVAPFNHLITASAEAGYNEDKTTYGCIKWWAGEYEEYLIMYFTFDENFKGGKVEIKTDPSCGADNREGFVPANVNADNSAPAPTTVTVEETAQPAPAPTITAEGNVVTAAVEGDDANHTVELYIVNADGTRTKVDNPYTVTQTYEEQKITFVAVTLANDDESGDTECTPVEIPIPALDKNDVDSPSIQGMTGENGTYYIIIAPAVLGKGLEVEWEADPTTSNYTVDENGIVTLIYNRGAEDVPVYVLASTKATTEYNASDVADATITVPALPQVKTPEITYVVNDNNSFTVTATCETEGATIVLKDKDGNIVTNPVTVPYDPYVGYNGTWTATATAPYYLPSETGSKLIEIGANEKIFVDSPSIVGMSDEDGLHFTITIIPGTTDGQLVYTAEPMGTLMRAATVNIQYERKAEDYYVDVDAYTTEGATYAESEHATDRVRVPALPQTAKPSVTYSYENGKLNVWAYGSDDNAVYTLYCDGEKYTGEMPITYDIYEGYGPHTWTATAIAPNKLESELSDPVEITIDEESKVYYTPAPVIGEPVVTAENVTFTVTGEGTVTVTVTTSEGTKTYTGEEGSVTVVLPRGEEYDMAIVNATAKANKVPEGFDAVAPGRVGPEYIDIPAKVYSAAPVIVPTPGKSEWDEEGNQTVDGHYVVVTFEAVDGAEVYYRIDGEGEFVKWDGTPIYFRDNGDYTIEAYAVEPGKMPSEVVPQSIHVTEATSVNGLVNGKTVAGVRYFNMAGQEMQEANGVTIVVTTYTDGTTSAVKVIK